MTPNTRCDRRENKFIVRRNLSGTCTGLLCAILAASACKGGRPDAANGNEADAGSSSVLGGAGGTSSSTTTPTTNSGGSTAIHIGSGGSTSTAGGTTATTAEPAVCGNGKQEQGEACDDGNTNTGDGCTSNCGEVEEGYVCPEPGKPCVRLQKCGDKKINGTENCDDGNTASGDGCSENCRTENGWSCPVVGVRCVADQCGDGIVAGAETCDDGQQPPKSGDGCSDTCTTETPGQTDRDGWVCETAGQPCKRTTCGNGNKEGTEQCDDGNNDSGDGCTPACRVEPSCPADGGACRSVCGDGMLLPTDTDQECDDGNSANGDGCSSECKKETGYECTDSQVQATGKLILPVVYRDFKGLTVSVRNLTSPTETELASLVTSAANGEHPDFEVPSNNMVTESGIVQKKLGANGKPVHSSSNMQSTMNNNTADTPDWFSIWFRDAVENLPTQGSPRYNYTFVDWLTLNETAANSGTFTYTNNSFYPLDGRTPSWGNTPGQQRNYHFTSEVRYWFQYSGNETLTFTGDDDVWVFVNKQLALDLGGIHTVVRGSVQLDASNGSGTISCNNNRLDCSTESTVDFGLEIGKVYEIVVFQAERHTVQSNYTLTVSAFKATRSTCKSICGDGIVTPDEACDLGKEKNTGEYGTCTPDCKLPAYCGDGKVDSNDGEQCDDGANLASYGYNGKAACGPGCKLTNFCGDGKTDSLFGEQCDDGNRTSGDGCENNCTPNVGCGNGIVEDGEQCDDGNTVSGDSCTEFCTIPVIIV